LCFEDKTKGELVVGYRPGGDREVQIKKVKACLRAANLSIPPMRVEPFRATRGGNGHRVTRSQTVTDNSKDDKSTCSNPMEYKKGSLPTGKKLRCKGYAKMMGGLGIIAPMDRKEIQCTLGTIGIVINRNGTEGFVTAGHVVDYDRNPVYQGGRLIGHSSNISTFRKGASDSAFVAFEAFEEKVTGIKNIVLSKSGNHKAEPKRLSITPNSNVS